MKSRKVFLKKVIKVSTSLLNLDDINKNAYNVTKFVVLHFYVKAIKLAKGILRLCNDGLISDAKILLRPLFEAAYYCEYILIDLNDLTAAENILAVAALEDKDTIEYIDKYGGVDIDKLRLSKDERKLFKHKSQQHSQNKLINYNFIVDRIRKRSANYTNLSDDKIFAKEGIKNKAFLDKVNQKFNEETKEKDFWKRYKTVLRDCSKSIHVLDFGINVEKEKQKLIYKFEEREESGEMILSATSNFLIRIMDITNDVFEFKADKRIKSLFDEAKRSGLQ